jgi:hypothetical protein
MWMLPIKFLSYTGMKSAQAAGNLQDSETAQLSKSQTYELVENLMERLMSGMMSEKGSVMKGSEMNAGNFNAQPSSGDDKESTGEKEQSSDSESE